MFHLFICYFDLTQHRRLHAVLYTVNKRTISRSKVRGSIEAKRWVHTTRAQRTIWKYVLTTILYFTVSDSKERTTLHALIHVVVGRKKISMIIQFMAMLTACTSCSRLIESRRSVAVCLPAKAYYVIKSMYPHAKQRDETEHAPRLLHEKASRFPLIVQSPRLSWSRNRFMLDEDKQKRRISKPGRGIEPNPTKMASAAAGNAVLTCRRGCILKTSSWVPCGLIKESIYACTPDKFCKRIRN